MIFEKLIAEIEAYRYKKQYEDATKKSVYTALTFELIFGKSGAPQSTEHIKHPAFDLRIKEFENVANKLPTNKELTINFGDSLTDLARSSMTNMDAIFSIAGSWHYHMSDVAVHMKSFLNNLNIKNVAVGTLGGNPLLVYQNLQFTIDESKKALDKIRELFPNSRIIVYGLPPTFNIHVSENTYTFDLAMISWVQSDKNAVFISLKNLGSFFGIFPAGVKFQVDGVHFNPRGAYRFNEAIQKAKSVSPGSIVNV